MEDNSYSPPTLMLLFNDQRATHAVTAAPCNELAVPSFPDAPDESFAITDYSKVPKNRFKWSLGGQVSISLKRHMLVLFTLNPMSDANAMHRQKNGVNLGLKPAEEERLMAASLSRHRSNGNPPATGRRWSQQTNWKLRGDTKEAQVEAAKDLVEKLKEVIGAGGFVDTGIINDREALEAQNRLLPVLDFYSEPQAQ